MCGIVGYFDLGKTYEETLITKMVLQIKHRGPNSNGVAFGLDRRLAFGHARLSILDLSTAGHQPMSSKSERFLIVYNGEIYNHESIRLKLQSQNASIKWIGTSDTETILAAFDAWGVKETIDKCHGMFAMAIWDKHENKLLLVRDRIGEKPLYYGIHDQCLLFGSELKSFKNHPKFNKKIQTSVIPKFMQLGYIPAPFSIYETYFKVMPGEIIELNLNNLDLKKYYYWNAIDKYSATRAAGEFQSYETCILDLENLLKKTISRQLISDVPLGAFLSGGIDSSTIVALMQSISKNKVETFTIGFENKNFDEAVYAKKVAQHLGTDHTEVYLSPSTALDVIPLLTDIYDEPFADSSQIPTYLVSKIASHKVTVCLSGDGGDELFAGYNRYLFTDKLWSIISIFPHNFRRHISNLLLYFKVETYNQLGSFLHLFSNSTMFGSTFGDKIHKGLGVLGSKDDMSLYLNIISAPGFARILNTSLPEPFIKNVIGENLISRMMLSDLVTYLPDDILAKVDRASMANSLETRVPFLDHEVVEFSWKMPLDFKLRNGSGKQCIRDILYKYVPKELIERPKMGFGIPLAEWIRNDLRPWCDELINSHCPELDLIVNTTEMMKVYNEHIHLSRNWSSVLWNYFILKSWLLKNC
jgi:asparagine synthase (glutamine-hydrolysing)